MRTLRCLFLENKVFKKTDSKLIQQAKERKKESFPKH